MRKPSFAKRAAANFVLLFAAFVVFVPFYWMLVSSLKPEAELFASEPTFIPTSLYLENYKMLLVETKFLPWLLNSVIISGGTVLLGLLICSLTGFVFAVYDFKFKKLLFWIILGSVTIPEIVVIIPLFVLMINFRLINTYLSLILPYAMNIFGIFLLKQYITMSVPFDLIYCARVDGASESWIYWKIVLPLSRAGMGVLAVFLWLHSWLSYFWPLIMLKTEGMFTLPLGLATLYANPWNRQYTLLMTGAFLATLPVIILFVFVQDTFVSGLTTGAIKE